MTCSSWAPPAASSAARPTGRRSRGFVGGAAAAGGPRGGAGASGLPGGGGGRRACSAPPTTPRKAACWSRWPRRRSAGPTRRAPIGATLDLERLCPRRRARRAALRGGRRPRSWHRLIRRTATSWRSWPGEHGVPALPGGPRRERPGSWNCGRGPACSVGSGASAKDLFRGDSAADAARRRGCARWESRGMCGIIGVSGIPDAARLSLPRPLRPAAPGAGERRDRGRGPGGQRPCAPRHGARLGELPRRRVWTGSPATWRSGHTRYSTTGSTVLANAQPCSVNTRCGAAGDRPQRQPHQRDRAQARAGGEGRHLHHLVRHRGAGAPHRALRGRRRSRARSGTRWSRWRAPTVS